MKLIALGLVALAATTSAVDIDAAEKYDVPTQQKIVKTKEAKWKAALNSTGGAYVMVFSRDCMCLHENSGPYHVAVNSTGGVASAVFMKGGSLGGWGGNNAAIAGTPVKQTAGKIKTIRDIFGDIKRALNQKADAFGVTYDEDLGYPTEVYIDYDKFTTDSSDHYYVESLFLL